MGTGRHYLADFGHLRSRSIHWQFALGGNGLGAVVRGAVCVLFGL